MGESELAVGVYVRWCIPGGYLLWSELELEIVVCMGVGVVICSLRFRSSATVCVPTAGGCASLDVSNHGSLC